MSIKPATEAPTAIPLQPAQAAYAQLKPQLWAKIGSHLTNGDKNRLRQMFTVRQGTGANGNKLFQCAFPSHVLHGLDRSGEAFRAVCGGHTQELAARMSEGPLDVIMMGVGLRNAGQMGNVEMMGVLSDPELLPKALPRLSAKELKQMKDRLDEAFFLSIQLNHPHMTQYMLDHWCRIHELFVSRHNGALPFNQEEATRKLYDLVMDHFYRIALLSQPDRHQIMGILSDFLVKAESSLKQNREKNQILLCHLCRISDPSLRETLVLKLFPHLPLDQKGITAFCLFAAAAAAPFEPFLPILEYFGKTDALLVEMLKSACGIYCWNSLKLPQTGLQNLSAFRCLLDQVQGPIPESDLEKLLMLCCSDPEALKMLLEKIPGAIRCIGVLIKAVQMSAPQSLELLLQKSSRETTYPLMVLSATVNPNKTAVAEPLAIQLLSHLPFTEENLEIFCQSLIRHGLSQSMNVLFQRCPLNYPFMRLLLFSSGLSQKKPRPEKALLHYKQPTNGKIGHIRLHPLAAGYLLAKIEVIPEENRNELLREWSRDPSMIQKLLEKMPGELSCYPALLRAAVRGHLDTFDLLLQRSGCSQAQTERLLCAAARYGKKELLPKLIDRFKDIPQTQIDEWLAQPPLVWTPAEKLSLFESK